MWHVCQFCTGASLALFLHLCPRLHPLLSLSLSLQVTGFATCTDLCLTVMRQKDPSLFSSLNSFNYSHFLSFAASTPFVSWSIHGLFFGSKFNFHYFLRHPSHLRLLSFVYCQSRLSSLCVHWNSSFLHSLPLTVAEWQAVQAGYTGCPFERAAVESKLLPHSLTSSLTAWNNTALTDTWRFLGVDEEEEKTVGDRPSFNVNLIIRDLSLINCGALKKITTLNSHS